MLTKVVNVRSTRIHWRPLPMMPPAPSGTAEDFLQRTAVVTKRHAGANECDAHAELRRAAPRVPSLTQTRARKSSPGGLSSTNVSVSLVP